MNDKTRDALNDLSYAILVIVLTLGIAFVAGSEPAPRDSHVIVQD